MDISILITNHNYDCTLLKHNLIGASEHQCEIIVIDDCSPSGAMLDGNIRTAQSLSECKYIVNEERGRRRVPQSAGTDGARRVDYIHRQRCRSGNKHPFHR